ncbi:DUF1127 domain-containing protein [Aliiroseovarius sp. 2305UL8-7]|uniref:DUF1127 domain-containing protein n=1 Tax=Aliiroseovarius conchicola TaxID=3121637 RepID=UPI0035283C4E
MEYGDTYRHDRLAFLDTRSNLPALAEIALLVAVTVTKWSQRRKMRQALKTLQPHLLEDIGVTQTEAGIEAEKPFWQP